MKDMRQYEIFELSLSGPEPSDSYVTTDIAADFLHVQTGEKIHVKGFYAGNSTYKVRFLPQKEGKYQYEVTGAVREKGEFLCECAAKNRHGIVRADGTHFRYEDGTWYYPFGTTVYALAHQTDELTEQTFETLAASPFNKVRMCVFPKHFEYNNNEPPFFAFEKKNGKWDVHRPDMRFWNRLESYIGRLDEMGIQCDLILFHPYDHWGFSEFPRREALVYLEYVTRRLSAFPNVWWSLANEYDLMEYRKEDWECFAQFLHENDGYRHLLSNHEIVTPWDFSNPDTTHICHQTGEILKTAEWIQEYQKPLMIDETGYEGNLPFEWGNLSAFELVNRFWTVCVQGGYCTHGETYLNEEEILWWSKGGRLTGQSPERIRFLKNIIDALPGPVEAAGHIWTEAEFHKMKEQVTEQQRKVPFTRMMLGLTWEQARGILGVGRELEGHCGEEAYIKYYARHCTGTGSMNLPEQYLYDIEVIDVWEMTHTKILEGVSGEVRITLPGKEGIAVMAVRKG